MSKDTGRVRWAKNNDSVAVELRAFCVGCGLPRGIAPAGRHGPTVEGWMDDQVDRRLQKEMSPIAERRRMHERVTAEFRLTLNGWNEPCGCGGRGVVFSWGSHFCPVTHRHYKCPHLDT